MPTCRTEYKYWCKDLTILYVAIFYNTFLPDSSVIYFNKPQEKHGQTQKYFATYNALMEIKELMLKQISLLNSINSQVYVKHLGSTTPFHYIFIFTDRLFGNSPVSGCHN